MFFTEILVFGQERSEFRELHGGIKLQVPSDGWKLKLRPDFAHENSFLQLRVGVQGVFVKISRKKPKTAETRVKMIKISLRFSEHSLNYASR